MADKPLPEDDKLPEAEAEERFNRTLRNLVNTPHKPHSPLAPKPRDGVSRKRPRP
jgi:hypothetical protein